MLEITTEVTDTHTLCRPVGDIDAWSVAQFRETLVELAESKRLIIDLSEVPFMDSAGLGALIGGIRRVREAEGVVAVACERESILRMLHTTGFNRIVPVVDSVAEAVKELTEAKA